MTWYEPGALEAQRQGETREATDDDEDAHLGILGAGPSDGQCIATPRCLLARKHERSMPSRRVFLLGYESAGSLPRPAIGSPTPDEEACGPSGG